MANKYTDAQAKATRKYLSKTVSIQIRLTPEEREKIRAKADAQGLSLAQYIIKKLRED